LISKARRM